MFFLVIENIVSCLLFALIGTTVLCSICGILPKWLNPNFSYKLLHYIVLLVASIALFTQILMFSGVSYAKGYISKIERGILSVHELLDKYPELIKYADAYTNTDELKTQSLQILGPIYQHLNSYLWKYGIGIFITTLLLIIFFIFQANTQQRKGSSSKTRNTTRRRRSYDF